MYKKSFLQPILFGLITIFLIASCDKDFNELGTDIVGDDHFGFELDTSTTVKIYNQKLGAIGSNNLAVNPLGFYTNPAFGTTQANFVTQVELSSLNPTFNNTTPGDYSTEAGHGPTVLDSVIIEVPYFRKLVDTDDDGKSTFILDSIYGVKPNDQTAATNNSKFQLEVFQSGYYLRDLDPNEGLGAIQPFYTDENTVVDNSKGTLLNNAPQADIPTEGIKNVDGHENSSFYFDKREHAIKTVSSEGVLAEEPTRVAPGMRLHLDKAFFDNLILHAPAGKLADNATFKNYFRGLYFKVSGGNPGNMAMLNFKAGKISLYYNEDKKSTVNTVVSYTRVYKTFSLNLNGNSISLLKNTFEDADYLMAANSSNEASRVYLKGGEGSMAIIDLFGSVDLKGYTLNPTFNENLPISTTNPKYIVNNTPNGISDQIDDIKINGWLINEANLTFNIDNTRMRNSNPDTDKHIFEPGRIYLYDITNKKALIDYSYDLTANSVYPKYNKAVFGGVLTDSKGFVVKQIRGSDGFISNKGSKYKIKITEYVRNLIRNDSTNVRLGLSVTENINNIGFSKLRTATNIDRAPTMSVMNPLGTILYGTNIPVAQTQEYKKRLKLEIYYTKPN